MGITQATAEDRQTSPSSPLMALTLRQPWASLVVGVPGRFEGPKRVENRSRRLFKDPRWIAIHAGSHRLDSAAAASLLADLEPHSPQLPPLSELPHGAVLGFARVDRVVHLDEAPEFTVDPWAFGPWCLVIGRVIPLAEPLRARGYPGLWRAPAPLPELLASHLAPADAPLEPPCLT